MPSSGSGAASGVLGTGWPTAAEVTTRLTEMGLTAPSTATLNATINAAVAAWEHATGYHPFLNSSSTLSTRYFPITNGLIDFQGGIFAVPTTFTAGGYYDSAGAYTGGTARVVGRDFILKPDNALAEGRPFTYAKVPGWYSSEPSPLVAVNAPFGYGATVPADVWEAVMLESLCRLFGGQPVTGATAQKIKQGPVEWDYGSGNSSLNFSNTLLTGFAKMTVMGYRRARIA